THAGGLRAQRPDEVIEFVDDTEYTTYRSTLRLITDGPLDAYAEFGSGFHRDDLEFGAKQFMGDIAPMLIDVDAFDRELIWQKLWYTQRFFYTGRGIVDQIDRMLWNLASRHARQPIFKLLGGCRDKVPAYRNIGGSTIDELVASGVQVKEDGFKGCKDHSYRGVKGNIELFTELRAALGDDFLLMHDAVEHYTYTEAVKVGRALEKLNLRWIEEPLQDYDLMGLKKLCATLDLPVLALEWIGAIGGQPFNTSAFLALQATDIARQRGIGITGQIKQAQLCESFGVQCHGGDHHVILAVGNDPLYESASGLGPLPQDAQINCLGTAYIEDGYLRIAYNDQPAPEPDWDEVERNALAVI
ncbi:MAG: hypothetical protein CMO73_09885, partial [Verrucomicrobiales bacterium]|nr:hypothetical protein [Verrucomicrobiales bacterium]